MERNLSGKTALVTGSTSGLGKDIAGALAQAGCNIALNGFGDRAEIELLQARLKSDHGVQVFYHGANLMVPSEISDLVAQTTNRLGPVDILVNNAGIQFVAPIQDFPDEKWDAVIALNLSAAFHTTKTVLPGMKTRRWGRIINIASAHALVASPFKSAYIAAKHGLVGLTKVTALETAREGITCNALCPGFLHTPLVEGQIDAQARATGIAREKVIEDIILAKHATKEFVGTDHVAAFVLLLCSDAGASTTGAAIPIDGGWTSS
jgi:3-hydroxybutyrate dehydrogenase